MQTTDYIEDINFLVKVMENWNSCEDGNMKEHLYLSPEDVLTLNGTSHTATRQALMFKAMFNKTKQELTIQ